MRASNDNTKLVPRTSFREPILPLDFPGLAIGSAEYDEGPTGCTVFFFPERASMAVDVRGGSPGFLRDAPLVDAICLAGGSSYGLEACAGVEAELLAMRDYSTRWDDIALVSGAVIYDLRQRDNAIYPDKALGRAAFKSSTEGRFPLGAQGAGRSATAGKAFRFLEGEASGQGGAFRRIGDIRIALFTVVNAVGAIINRQGQVVRGNRDPATGIRYSPTEAIERAIEAGRNETQEGSNTTLTVLVTNQTLDRLNLQQLGRSVHASMARAIQPFHAVFDGDVFFCCSTGQVEDPAIDTFTLTGIGCELAWDAVLSSIS